MSFTTELSFLTTSPDRKECEVFSSNATAWHQNIKPKGGNSGNDFGRKLVKNSRTFHHFGSESHRGPSPISKESSAIVQILLVLDKSGKVEHKTSRSI